MNVVEAYLKFNGKLIIFLSGMSGCGKTSIAKNLKRDFKLELIDEFKYYKKDYNNKIQLPDGTEVVNWYTDDSIDWDRLNKDIEKQQSKGVIVSGFSLPDDKIEVKPDFHIHLSISKQECIERRK